MISKFFVVEYLQHSGDFEFDDFFFDYDVAVAYIESQEEDEPETFGRFRITSYVPDGAVQTYGERVDYTLAQPEPMRLKRPEYITTQLEVDQAVASQNPYAFAPGNGIVNEEY